MGLEDFLEDREKRIKDEKQKQLDVLAKAKEKREEMEQKFLNAMITVVKPKLTKLVKIFSEKGHRMQFHSEKISGIPLELKYTIELSGAGIPFMIEFNSNKGNVDIAFTLYKANTPNRAYSKDFSFDSISEDSVEAEIVKGLSAVDM